MMDHEWSATGPQGLGGVVRRSTAVVAAVENHAPGAVALQIFSESNPDTRARAIAYPSLSGLPAVGDRVLLNTTAVDLELGTGGAHFVIAILEPSSVHAGAPGTAAGRMAPIRGHVMKLRYTPHQCAVLAAEEEGSSLRGAADGEEDLDRAPVVACELHSQVAAVCAGFLSSRPDGRVVYVMTSGGSMPLAFSHLIPSLRDAGLLHATVTAGQCFGGDEETINVYSGLLTARLGLGADLIVVGQGPGNAGTGTRFGFSGIEQGEAANAAASLGGRPIICIRASAADPRARHQFPSHHTLTVLDRVARCRCSAAIARDVSASHRKKIMASLDALEIPGRHDILADFRGSNGLDLLKARGIHVTTMGRDLDQDREFFLHAAAAGGAAAAMIEARV